MNDEDFIKELSADILEYYLKAKQVFTDSPELSLVFLRSYAYDLCGLVGNHENSVIELTTLFRRVEKLVRKRYLTQDLAELFHDIRKDANKGAHPEQFNITKQQYHSLALANLKKCCVLTEKVYSQVKIADPPPYVFYAPSNDSIKDLCYEALIHQDSEAQYFVGLSLKSKGEALRQVEFLEAEETELFLGNTNGSESFLRQAEHLFEQAAHQNHIKAMYEYGCVLLQKENKNSDALGVEWINRSAVNGYDSALSRMGLMHFSGTGIVVQDRQLALGYLERAAAAEHPEALTQLGAIYFEGRDVGVDTQKGFDYSYKGALAGYPEAQYNLALYYLEGLSGTIDNAKGLDWLSQSVDQGCSKAEMHLASILVEGRILPGDREKAYDLYLSAVSKDDLEAMIEFALLCKDDIFSKDDHLVESADYLQLSYERAGEGSAIGEIVLEEAPAVVERLRQYMVNSQIKQEEFNKAYLVSELFDDKGAPYIDRKERIADISQNIMDMNSNLGLELTKVVQNDNRKIGRNDLCFCGSGKKYKKCCL